ncbi:MAG: FAD-dependent oxidoreductase [Acidobacteriota bacterium]
MKVAIIGSGIAGLAAAHDLHRDHEITLFEAAEHVGGHVITVEVEDRGRALPVDMGFIVYNRRTYPELVRLFEQAGVETQPSDMGFSVRHESDDGADRLEWAGSSLDSLFAQRRNLLRPSFWRMLRGVVRLNRSRHELLAQPPGVRLGQYLDHAGFRGPVVDWYLLPMLSAVWSTEPRRMLDFPAATLGRFLDNHGLLTLTDRPQWRVVRGGSARYVEALTADFADRIRLGTPVRSVRRAPDRVVVETVHGERDVFDGAVIATHSDQALRLLADPTDVEQHVLGAIPYIENEVVLHTDERLMPRRRNAWAAWNYHLLDQPSDRTRVTYWMNKLQSLDAERDYFVTLNRTDAVRADRILHRRSMAHPLFTAESDAAKSRWAEISGDRTVYAGAYWRFGFHEDGVLSGRRAARALRARLTGRLGQPDVALELGYEPALEAVA